MFCNLNNWGHPLWCILHLLSMLINMKDIEKMKILLENLQYLIPCNKCKKNYKIKLQKYLKNGDEWRETVLNHKKILIYSLIIMHQQINIENNKKRSSVHEYYKYWLSRRNKKRLLEIYLNNLKLCTNVPRELIFYIENISIIE